MRVTREVLPEEKAAQQRIRPPWLAFPLSLRPRLRPRSPLPLRYSAIALGSGLMLLGGGIGLPAAPFTSVNLQLRSFLAFTLSFSGVACLIGASLQRAAPSAWHRFFARYRRLTTGGVVALALATLAVFLGAGYMALFSPLSHAYWSDVLAFTYTNAKLVLHGQNPYTASDAAFRHALQQFPLALETPLHRGFFGGSLDYPSQSAINAARLRYLSAPPRANAAFDPRVLHSYPALSFLLYVPLVWAGLRNVLFLNVAVFWGLYAWIVWQAPKSKRGWTALVALAGITTVVYSLFLDTEVICIALLLAAWHWRDRRWLSPILLGLACAFKQYSWFFVPFFAVECYLERGWRETLKRALGAFLLPNLPYIVASPRAWWTSLWLPMKEPLFPIGQGIVLLSTGHLLPYLPSALFAGLEVVALLVSLGAYWRWRTQLGDAALLLALVPLLFAFRSLSNYFAFMPWIALYAANQVYARRQAVARAPSWMGETLRLQLYRLQRRAVAVSGVSYEKLPSWLLLPLEGERRAGHDDDTPDEQQDDAPSVQPLGT